MDHYTFTKTQKVIAIDALKYMLAHLAMDLSEYPNSGKLKGLCALLSRALGEVPDIDDGYLVDRVLTLAFRDTFGRNTKSGYWWREPRLEEPSTWRDQGARLIAIAWVLCEVRTSKVRA